jgi:hypothetical protein
MPKKDDDGERFQIVFIDGRKRAQRYSFYLGARPVSFRNVWFS